MALIKTNSMITDIRGRLAGNVFKRDSSGLHITAKNRYIRKEKTPYQIAQNDWYCALKREEYSKGPPAPEEPEPHSPSTGLLYQADYITFIRKRTLLQPDVQNVPDYWDGKSEAGMFILDNWNMISKVPHITQLFASELLYHYWYRNFYTYKMTYQAAKLAAQEQLMDWVGNRLLYADIAIEIPRWTTATGFLIVAVIHDFFSPHTIVHRFSAGESVIRLGDDFYWARLIARPSKKMYDFLLGPVHSIPPLTTTYYPEREDGHSYILGYGQAYQTNIIMPLHWNVFVWHQLEITSRVEVYMTSLGFLRCCMRPGDIHYYNVPVGWTFAGNPFAFVDTIFED